MLDVPSHIKNLLDQEFGRLKVIEYIGWKNSNHYWKCLCSCGVEIETMTTALTKGTIDACKTCQIKFRPKTQKCIDCGVEKPFNEEFFYKHANQKSGLYTRCKECFKERSSENGELYRQRMRLDAIYHYSNNNPKCACCGENHLEFLALDHINGGGNKERKELKKMGTNMFVYLFKKGYPEGYRVLCHNCNMSLGCYGYCPHKVGGNENE